MACAWQQVVLDLLVASPTTRLPLASRVDDYHADGNEEWDEDIVEPVDSPTHISELIVKRL